MVTRVFFVMRTPAVIGAACCALWLAASVPAKASPDYKLGDPVSADIVAPKPMIVIDTEATAVLKEKEALKVPAILLFHPEVADEVEQSFRAKYSLVRSSFFEAMDEVYQRKRLNRQWLDSTRFKTLSSTFRRQHAGFPELTNLMALWAVGDADGAESVENDLVARLREAMQQRIRPDGLPPGIKLGPQVRLVTATNLEDPLTLEFVQKRGVAVHRTNFVNLSRVKQEFQQAEFAHARGQGRFLASFLMPNCTLNAELTLLSRRHQVASLYVADRYEAGQIIARGGQTVDAKILAALEQLKSVESATRSAEQRGKAELAQWVWDYLGNVGFWVGAASALAILLFGVWKLLTPKKPTSLLPARVAGEGTAAAIITCPSCDENIIIPTEAIENLAANAASWPRQELGEEDSEDARADLRARVMPHLAEWLKKKFVRRLVSERTQMLDAQESATAELAELERRLDELHAPLQERLHAYEKRIVELEQLLAAKGEENRELLRAKIQMTRKQLESARAQNRLEYN